MLSGNTLLKIGETLFKIGEGVSCSDVTEPFRVHPKPYTVNPLDGAP
jgi:hypothetical protein